MASASSIFRYPGESAKYRAARDALLAEEIDLRRQAERVAALRRTLPLGGEVRQDYLFEGEAGPVSLSALFDAHDTLVVYNWMYGPRRERPCPSCSSILSALDGNARDISQKVALAVAAGSPIARMAAFARERGWRCLRLVSAAANSFIRDYGGLTEEGAEMPGFNVFARREGRLHHSWGTELFSAARESGQDPRGADAAWPLWGVLDMTPGGRGEGWGSDPADAARMRFSA